MMYVNQKAFLKVVPRTVRDLIKNEERTRHHHYSTHHHHSNSASSQQLDKPMAREREATNFVRLVHV